MSRRLTALAGALAAAVVVSTAALGAAQPAAVRYTSFPAPGSLGSDTGEASVGVDWKTGAVFLQSGLETDKVLFNGTNATWSDVTSSTTGVVTLDAIGVTDNRLGRLIVSQLVGVSSLMAYSDDDGATWTTGGGSGLPAGYDHQSVGIGPYPAGHSGSYPHAVYYCSQEAVTALCSRSDNGGATFGASVPVFSFLDCAASHGHLRVAPDGTVYLPNPDCLGGQGVAVSTDAGASWTVHKVTGSSPGTSDPSIALGADGTGYFAFTAASGAAEVAVTRDRGASWTEPFDLGDQVGVRNAAFPEAIAGDGDRAAVAFLGTKTPGDAQDEFFGMNPSHTDYVGAEFHLYVATTYDRGRTWKTVDATPHDPVQRGRICLAGTTCTSSDRNLLDFMDITVDRTGQVVVGWADGCTGACVDSTLVARNSFSDHGTITKQTSGAGLFAHPPKL